jgi:hypothetical protein
MHTHIPQLRTLRRSSFEDGFGDEEDAQELEEQRAYLQAIEAFSRLANLLRKKSGAYRLDQMPQSYNLASSEVCVVCVCM